MKTVIGYLCPVCLAKGQEEPLACREHTYACPVGHSFDRSKSGYVNLLLPGDKHSKVPGDNQVMVAARQRFLNTGFYEPLARAVGGSLSLSLSEMLPQKKPFAILDAGCGEGYYTSFLRNALIDHQLSFRMFGVDISKIALDKAAKRDKNVEFAVASVFHLPVGNASCDALTILFAPYCAEEAQRVLKPGGLMLMVVPGERHLMEIKNALYDKPYVNETKDDALSGFTLVDHHHLEYPMEIDSGDIENLFMMTPYYYKTPKENAQRLLSLDSLCVTASFELLLYKKCDSGKE